MSWIIRNQNRIQVITGDGEVYEPDYVNPEYIQGYNLAEFEFRNVPGTLVDRQEPKGRRFRLELIFQGDLHLEEAERFRQSTFDKRPWTVIHPKYDELTVHPFSLRFDDTKDNLTRITGIIVETITGAFPNTTESPIDEINAKKGALDEQAAVSYDQELAPFNLDSNDAQLINNSIDSTDGVTSSLIEDDSQAAQLRNAVVNAKNKVTNSIGQATGFIRDVQAVINFPFQVETNVNDRINALIEAFNALPIDNLSRTQKKYYENNGAASLSSMCVASVTNSEYNTRSEVDFVINKVITAFNSFIVNLDAIQSETATEVDSYTPDEETVRGLYDIVNFTLSRLFEIALGSTQELILVVSEDTDPINLAHFIYGPSEDDSNLQTMIENNDIGISELFLIKKGREIKYYN